MERIFKLRGVLMIPPCLFAAFCTWNETENDAVVFTTAGILFFLGVVLRVWAQMHIHYRLKIKKILTKTGPYRFCRNPIYVANTLILLGFVAATELMWFMPVMLVYCGVVYTLVVRYEESHLRKVFGAPYETYLEEVPRWFPTKPAPKPEGTPEAGSSRSFFRASVLAELHSLALIIPIILKEFLD